MDKRKSLESGEIMLESLIVMLITIMVMIAMLGLGFVYYQKAMLTNLANEVAADVASNYKYCDQTIENQIDAELQDKLKNIRMYRTSFGAGSMQSRSKAKARLFAENQVNTRTLGINTSSVTLDDYDITFDNIGRMHVEITLEMQSEVLFSGALKAMNLMDKTATYKATGRAECIDITAYAGHVFFIQYIETKLEGSETLEHIRTICESIKSLMGL